MSNSRLLDLPDELLIVITEYVAEKRDLSQLAGTCRRLQHVSERLLYRTIFIRDDTQAKSLLEAVQANKSRAMHIQSLEIRGIYKGLVEIEQCCALLELLPRLREFIFESPYCNRNRWESQLCQLGWPQQFSRLMRLICERPDIGCGSFRAGPLQTLTKLTLHLNGINYHEFWDLEMAHSGLFEHPTLTALTISSVNFFTNLSFPAELCGKSPLQELRLEECNLRMQPFHSILSMPAALRYLYIGEACHCQDEIRSFPVHLKNHHQEFQLALDQQKASLEHLCYILGRHRGARRAGGTLDLSEYTALKSIDLPKESVYLNFGLTGETSTPPNLETLHIRPCAISDLEIDPPSRAFDFEIFDEHVRAIVAFNPRLLDLHIHLDLVVRYEDSGRTWVANCCDSWGKLMTKRKARLSVWVEPTDRGFVMPILYGEQARPDILIYTSDVGKFMSENLDPSNDESPREGELEDDDDDDDDDDDEFDIEEDSERSDDDDFDEVDEDDEDDFEEALEGGDDPNPLNLSHES